MNFWTELGLEPSDDIKKIKQAYSQKLKALDRKNDIEGFQRLHEAYQAALEAAKSGVQDAQETGLHSPFEIIVHSSGESNPSSPAKLNTPPGDMVSVSVSDRLHEALEQFFQEIARYPEIDCVQDAYERLRNQFSIGRDLLQSDLMDHFLHKLYVFLKEHPSCADTNLIQHIFRDLQIMQDIKLYQEYEYSANKIRELVHVEAQRRSWLLQVDERAATILTHKDIKAGYSKRRKRHVLTLIMEAIAELETKYPVLIGTYVSEEKLEFWKRIDRSTLITQDDLVNALWGFLFVPGLYAALVLQNLKQVLSPAMIVASYPLALIYVTLNKKLRYIIQENNAVKSFLDRTTVRLGTIVVNAIYAILAVTLNLQESGHAFSVVGIFSLYAVLVQAMPLAIMGMGAFLGSLVLAFAQPGQEIVDLALAIQLGTALFFLLVAAQTYGKIFWNRWRPKNPEKERNESTRPPLLTMRNIVIAIILLKILAALSRLRL